MADLISNQFYCSALVDDALVALRNCSSEEPQSYGEHQGRTVEDRTHDVSPVTTQQKGLPVILLDHGKVVSPKGVVERAVSSESYFHLLKIWCCEQLPGMQQEMKQVILSWLKEEGRDCDGIFKELVEWLALDGKDVNRCKDLFHRVVVKKDKTTWPYWFVSERMLLDVLKCDPEEGCQQLDRLVAEVKESKNGYAAYCLSQVLIRASVSSLGRDESDALSDAIRYLYHATDPGTDIGPAYEFFGHFLRLNRDDLLKDLDGKDTLIVSLLSAAIKKKMPSAYSELADFISECCEESPKMIRDRYYLLAEGALLGNPKCQCELGALLVSSYDILGLDKGTAIRTAWKWLLLAAQTRLHAANLQLSNLYYGYSDVLGIHESKAKWLASRQVRLFLDEVKESDQELAKVLHVFNWLHKNPSSETSKPEKERAVVVPEKPKKQDDTKELKEEAQLRPKMNAEERLHCIQQPIGEQTRLHVESIVEKVYDEVPFEPAPSVGVDNAQRDISKINEQLESFLRRND